MLLLGTLQGRSAASGPGVERAAGAEADSAAAEAVVAVLVADSVVAAALAEVAPGEAGDMTHGNQLRILIVILRK